MKPSNFKFVAPVVSLMLLAGNVLAQNQGGNTQSAQITALQVAVSNLQATVTTQQSTIAQLGSALQGLQSETFTLQAYLATSVKDLQDANTTLQGQVATLTTSNATLGSRLQYVSVVGTDMYITGANLNIVNGTGSTEGWAPDGHTHVNGLGNLIVGYNEKRPLIYDLDFNNRTGSHNIVVGQYQNFSSFGGLVAGFGNTINGAFSSVSGGYNNTADGDYSSVSGGQSNGAEGAYSSVSGGALNLAQSGVPPLGPPPNFFVTDPYPYYGATSVSGGVGNIASGWSSSVSGGYKNVASGDWASVSGGAAVTASSYEGWAAGGSEHNP
jgi:hypothetical protein